MFNFLIAVLLLNNQNVIDTKYAVTIDLSYYEHGVNDEGEEYHYKNWTKSTGIIYKDDDGVWILTAAHIIPHGINHLIENSVFASFHPDLKHNPEEIEFMAYDRKIDVSLFKFVNQKSANNLPHAKLGKSANLKIGQQVLSIGSPLPIRFSATFGHINNLDITGFSINQNQPQLIAHSCMINAGSSGGPLINIFNEVIGINVMTLGRPNTFNLAVPSDDIKFLLPKLKRGGEIKHQTAGLIGFQYSFMLTDLNLKEMGIDIRPPQSGIMILGFKKNSLIELAGFRKGDIILSCNGKRMESLTDLYKMLYLKAEPYEFLKIEIDRYGKKMTLPLLMFDPTEKEIEEENIKL